jgi:hypothetical protein
MLQLKCLKNMNSEILKTVTFYDYSLFILEGPKKYHTNKNTY